MSTGSKLNLKKEEKRGENLLSSDIKSYYKAIVINVINMVTV